jgi:hypothetical protein
MPIRNRFFFATSAIALAVLVACGGGGGSNTPSGGTATISSANLQTYITDNLATDYSKVWVSIKKITATDSTGTEVTLFDAGATPVVVNLSSLASVGQFLSTVTIPAGIYPQVSVALDPSVQLVSLDGATTTNAKLSAGTADFIWKMKVDLDTSAAGQLVLDFNLARFTYDAASGIVTPVIEAPKPADAFAKFVRQQAEVHATVNSVDATAGKITIDDSRLGKGIVVTLSADAVIIDEKTGAVIKLTDLAVGARIEIKGKVTPGATTTDPVTVTTALIHIEPAGSPDAAPANRLHGEGTVTSVDKNLVTVKLAEANFLPGADTVVLDVTNAKFAHGQLNDVVTGAKVEFRGAPGGTGASTTVLVAVMDVAGADSDAERQKHPDQKFAAIHGTIAQVNTNGTFTITVANQEGPLVAPGTYTINSSQAEFEQGTVMCVVAGKPINALGALTGATLLAKAIELPGCGGQTHSELPKASPPAPVASGPAPGASAPAPAASGPH